MLLRQQSSGKSRKCSLAASTGQSQMTVQRRLGAAQSAAQATCHQKCPQSTAASVASRKTPLQTPGWPLILVGISVGKRCLLAVATPVCYYVTLVLAPPAPARWAPLAGLYVMQCDNCRMSQALWGLWHIALLWFQSFCNSISVFEELFDKTAHTLISAENLNTAAAGCMGKVISELSFGPHDQL